MSVVALRQLLLLQRYALPCRMQRSAIPSVAFDLDPDWCCGLCCNALESVDRCRIMLQDAVLRCRATLQHGSLTLISTSAASFSVSRLSWLGRRCGLIVLRATRHIARLSRLRHVPCCSPATPATPAGCYARGPTTVKGPPMGRTAAVYRTAIPHGTVSNGGTAASQASVTGCAGASRGSAACSAGPSATRTSRCRRTGSTYE